MANNASTAKDSRLLYVVSVVDGESLLAPSHVVENPNDITWDGLDSRMISRGSDLKSRPGSNPTK